MQVRKRVQPPLSTTHQIVPQSYSVHVQMSNGTIISREKFSGPDRVANLYTVPQDTHRITYSDSS